MIKLICIDAWNEAINEPHHTLRDGKNYIATGIEKSPNGQMCYVIPELPKSTTVTSKGIFFNKKPLYRCDRFLEVSELDELEIHGNG